MSTAVDIATAGLDERETQVRVAAREEVAEGVVALELRAPDGSALPPWRAGSHLDLVLAEGLERQYSLCGDPAERDVWRVAVLREPASRGGSQHVHDRLQVGDTLTVRGPRNHFALEPASRYVFIGGGIGITPLLPMILEAEAAGTPWTLYYGGRSTASMAFVERLAAHGDRVRIHPQDTHGLLPLAEVLAEPQDGTLVYCCGPEPLLLAVEAQTAAWPAGSLHVERFAPKEVGEPVRSESFRVTCTLSKLTVEVKPGTTILEALETAGAYVSASCREGTCGTCESPVLSGRPDHRDSLLTPEEQEAGNTMLICVSRSLDDELVLEI